MAQIERRQARIRCIKESIHEVDDLNEGIARFPNAHFHIGLTEDRPILLARFLFLNSEDPAVNVSLMPAT